MSENAEKGKKSPDDLPNINFMYKTMLARDPSKRRVKPTPTVELFPLTIESESEDSDFKIEEDDSDSASGSSSDSIDESETESEELSESEQNKTLVNGTSTGPATEVSVKVQEPFVPYKALDYQLPPEIPKVRVCCICLGTHSSDVNEVVECDSCGILVHEGCYGVTESGSVSSTASSCSTEPWFCEPCQGNVINPPCQMCPNLGGALKETDTGLWVHLVCALYTPGVAFGELDKLTQVTLFEMPYSRWGAKSCSLCSDPWLSRTGVCIGCDAGMCRTFFHVTCAQREGLLSETFHEETVQADPFYANCRLHTDKSTIKRRKQNYLSHQRHLVWWTNKRNTGRELLTSGQSEDVSLRRILRKLGRQRVKFQTKHWPRASWVPTQKMPRLLTTSASAVRRLRAKAVLMAVDVEAEEVREAQVSALADLPRKWHIPPAFSVEFIAYVLDRERRIAQLREQTTSMKEESRELDDSEKQWRLRYDCLIEEQNLLKSREAAFRNQLSTLHHILSAVSPKRGFNYPTSPRRSSEEGTSASRRSSRPSPPAKIRPNRDSVESVPSQTENSNQSSQDFWVADIRAGPSNRLPNMMQEGQSGSTSTKDVSPRMILKRVMKSASPYLVNKQKKTRIEDTSEGLAVSLKSIPSGCVQIERLNHSATPVSTKAERSTQLTISPTYKANGNASATPSQHGEVPKLMIKLKPILPKATQSGFPFIFTNSDSEHSQPIRSRSPSATRPESSSVSAYVESAVRTPVIPIVCSVCSRNGIKSDTVSCDECQRVFHFGCLDPPLKKTPKQRGYSWHCAECDPSEQSD
ncbi:hypothetical protein OUZ56_001464 [Daphnia magna]|uniref:PHD finger protein n=1 Tax=Daphnia magna TaxID=35525 RepID=A0ABR0A2Q9_9CRUS|nr:hypothetical protein OUZ56_001464 [Daphnia magna]